MFRKLTIAAAATALTLSAGQVMAAGAETVLSSFDALLPYLTETGRLT